MSELFLMKPSKEWEEQIWQYRQECLDFGEKWINGSFALHEFSEFDPWLNEVLAIEKEKLSRDGLHASTFFSIRKSDGKIIGSIQLRHFLTPEFEKHGGHIGYEIRPTERKKGYAKEQLRLVLNVARGMNIPRVMISCDKENIGSAKTAMRCGGVLTEEVFFNGKLEQIYWIDLIK